MRALLRGRPSRRDTNLNKEEKAALVDEIADRLGDASAIFAVDYRGISVPQAAELRAQLSEADATFRVVKNRLAKRAVERAGTPELDSLLVGPDGADVREGRRRSGREGDLHLRPPERDPRIQGRPDGRGPARPRPVQGDRQASGPRRSSRPARRRRREPADGVDARARIDGLGTRRCTGRDPDKGWSTGRRRPRPPEQPAGDAEENGEAGEESTPEAEAADEEPPADAGENGEAGGENGEAGEEEPAEEPSGEAEEEAGSGTKLENH